MMWGTPRGAQATKAAGTDDNADARMRSSVTVGLKRKLKDVMGDFQKLRQSIQVRAPHGARPGPEKKETGRHI